MGLWVLALSYCVDHLTDGAVSRDRITKIVGEKKLGMRLAERLVAAGLWSVDGDGFRFHDWAIYQPSAESTKAERDRKARNVAAYRDRKKPVTSQRVTAPVTVPVTGYMGDSLPVTLPACNHVPDPDPDPDPKERDQDQCSLAVDGRSGDRPDNVVALPTKRAKPTKRGTRCPASTADDVDAWLAEHKVPPLDGPWGADVARFLDYWAGVSGAKGTKLDWAATWRNYEADPRFPHPEGAAPGRKRVLAPVAAQQSPIPDLDGLPAFVREGLKAAGIKPIETPINDLGALLDLAAGRA
jgi:hypothetical protein